MDIFKVLVGAVGVVVGAVGVVDVTVVSVFNWGIYGSRDIWRIFRSIPA